MNENIQIVREAVLKVHDSEYERTHPRKIGLCDVLLAMEDRKIEKQLGFDKVADFALHMWNLRKDDLTQQSEETLQFLAELLR